MNQDTRTPAERTVDRLKDAAARPPAPIMTEFVHRTGAPTGVMHWMHAQDVNAFAMANVEPYTFPLDATVAACVRDLDDPLISLAQSLERMAGECRRHGVVPVGINVSTEHADDPDSFVRGRGIRRAVVSVDVTVIPRDWIITVIHKAEQDKNPTSATKESSEH